MDCSYIAVSIEVPFHLPKPIKQYAVKEKQRDASSLDGLATRYRAREKT
jgi:hypothetical protein